MADQRILEAVRDIWTDEEVATNRAIILNAIFGRLQSVTIIVGKSSESESAQGQVIVSSEDFKEMLDVLNARTREIADAAAGAGPLCETEHANFGRRFTRT